MGSVMEIVDSGNTYRVNKAQFDADNTVRIANNKKEAATTALKEFSRTLGNTQRIAAAGETYNANVASLQQELDAHKQGDINLALSATKQLGALHASAAASGIGGSSIELMDTATKLQRDIGQEANDAAIARTSKNAKTQIAQGITDAYSSQDNSVFLGNFDNTINIAPVKLKNKWGAIIGVAAATYFGGPQAGQAVADAVMASNKEANGDYQGAAQKWDSAFSNGVAGAKQIMSLQGGSGPKTWFGAVTERTTKTPDQTSGFSGPTFNFSQSDNGGGEFAAFQDYSAFG